MTKSRSYRDGYDYAAGSLLRKEETPRTLEEAIDMNPNDFDRGMNDAIKEVIRLGVVEDNRM